VYSVRTGRAVSECLAFVGQRIHGMRLGHTGAHQLLIAFGGKELAIFTIHCTHAADSAPSDAFAYLCRVWTFDSPRRDLIWEARLLQCAEACTHPAPGFDVALGYAHDRVEILSFTAEALPDADGGCLRLRCASRLPQVQCEDRSLLYSMCMHGACRHSLIVIGGTVFSHILVYDASVRTGEGVAASAAGIDTRPVLHRITGHDVSDSRGVCAHASHSDTHVRLAPL
jgi:hypothetical protein